jgi:hypothetical protein
MIELMSSIFGKVSVSILFSPKGKMPSSLFSSSFYNNKKMMNSKDVDK